VRFRCVLPHASSALRGHVRRCSGRIHDGRDIGLTSAVG
jgi:hypothetical protein